jgi:hypothetical protein
VCVCGGGGGGGGGVCLCFAEGRAVAMPEHYGATQRQSVKFLVWLFWDRVTPHPRVVWIKDAQCGVRC